MDISAVAQFLCNALRGADSLDLLVLKELIETLTGVTVDLDLSLVQVRLLRDVLLSAYRGHPCTRLPDPGSRNIAYRDAQWTLLCVQWNRTLQSR